MKHLATALLTALVLVCPVHAAEPGPKSTLLGTWAVDTSRLPMAPAARPKSVTITFTDAGGDQLGTKVEVVDPTGAQLLAEGVTSLDGKPTSVKSNFEADVSATIMPTADVLVMQLAKNGTPASTRIYAVGSDGKTMIETVAHFGPDGQPVLRRNYFTRVR